MSTNRVSKYLYSVLALCFLFTLALNASDWPSDVTGTWDFKSGAGTLKFVLLASAQSPDFFSLDMMYDGVDSISLPLEAEFLRDVVSQLPTAGADPRRLTRISMRGPMEREVAQRLAVAALHSKEWESRATVTGGAERVTEDLLNSLGAYDVFNEIFARYGLKIKVVGVEKVTATRCMDMRLPVQGCTRSHNVFVPSGANFDLELIRKK